MRGKLQSIDYLENTVRMEILGDLGQFKPGDLFELKKKRKNRTLSQNNLYWLFCEFCGMALDMTAEEVHDGFKMRHLKKKIIKGDQVFETTLSTSHLDVHEFGIYIDKCNITALEFGVDTSGFWEEFELYKAS